MGGAKITSEKSRSLALRSRSIRRRSSLRACRDGNHNAAGHQRRQNDVHPDRVQMQCGGQRHLDGCFGGSSSPTPTRYCLSVQSPGKQRTARSIQRVRLPGFTQGQRWPWRFPCHFAQRSFVLLVPLGRTGSGLRPGSAPLAPDFPLVAHLFASMFHMLRRDRFIRRSIQPNAMPTRCQCMKIGGPVTPGGKRRLHRTWREPRFHRNGLNGLLRAHGQRFRRVRESIGPRRFQPLDRIPFSLCPPLVITARWALLADDRRAILESFPHLDDPCTVPDTPLRPDPSDRLVSPNLAATR